jgi:hypothetical protein
MRKAYFFGESCFAYAVARARDNRDIEMPPDSGSIPILPDEERDPPVDAPPDQPRRPEDQPDPPPIREPNPNEPTWLF